jgi:hypothetical protein
MPLSLPRATAGGKNSRWQEQWQEQNRAARRPPCSLPELELRVIGSSQPSEFPVKQSFRSARRVSSSELCDEERVGPAACRPTAPAPQS